MTDGSERPAGLSEKRTVFFHGAHRKFTARFIGLVRVSKGGRRTSEASEAPICRHRFFFFSDIFATPLSTGYCQLIKRGAQRSPR